VQAWREHKAAAVATAGKQLRRALVLLLPLHLLLLLLLLLAVVSVVLGEWSRRRES
jgi:hypothetical protein